MQKNTGQYYETVVNQQPEVSKMHERISNLNKSLAN